MWPMDDKKAVARRKNAISKLQEQVRNVPCRDPRFRAFIKLAMFMQAHPKEVTSMLDEFAYQIARSDDDDDLKFLEQFFPQLDATREASNQRDLLWTGGAPDYPDER